MTSPVTVSGRDVKTPVGSAPVIPLLLIGFGGYLLWFGVRYFRGTGPAVWPSYPIKSVLQGKGLPGPNQAPAATVQVAAYEGGAATTMPGTPPHGPATSGSGQAQNTARLLLSRYGWQVSEMGPLIQLWTRESSWSSTARNPTSGALGIAQALGHGTAQTGGTLGNEYGAEYGLTVDQARQANSGSALQQIRWGLGYIRARYGSPSAAWQHETAVGWY